MVAPPACVLGCVRKFLFCRWSSTPPKNWMFLGRLLVSQNAANIAKRHADQTRSGAPRQVGLLHRISTGTPVLCAFPPSPTAISASFETKKIETNRTPNATNLSIRCFLAELCGYLTPRRYHTYRYLKVYGTLTIRYGSLGFLRYHTLRYLAKVP